MKQLVQTVFHLEVWGWTRLSGYPESNLSWLYHNFIYIVGGVAESPSDAFHEKIWFIFICAIVVIVILVTLTALIAALRWRAKRKGKKYPGMWMDIWMDGWMNGLNGWIGVWMGI